MDIFSFLLVFILIWYFSRNAAKKVSTNDDYLLAGRHTGLFPLVATLVMTEFNTSTLISFSSVGYLAGYWALTLPLVFLFGLIFYAISVAKKWKDFNGLSVAHYFARRYGRDIEYFVAIVLFIAMLGFSSTYIKSLTLIFLPVIPINNWELSGILVIFVLVLTIRGGLKSIIALDICSFLFILFFFPLLLYFTYKLPQLNNIHTLTIKESQVILPPKFIISLIILTMFSYIVAPWYGQKIVSAKNAKTAYLAALIAAIIIFILYGFGILSNAILKYKGVKLDGAELGIPYLIHNAMPKGLQGFSYAIIFFIAASTLSGVWNAMVTLIFGSIYTKHSNILKNELVIIAIASIAYIIANTLIDNILNKMILLNIPIVALSFALLGGFYWKRANRLGAYCSIAIGIFWGCYCYLKYGEAGLYTWYWALYGIPLIFIIGVSVSLVSLSYKFKR